MEKRNGNRGMGRVRGIPNKVTRDAKEIIAEVAQKLGGVDRLHAWAQESPENERAFWTIIYTKLIPYQANIKASVGIAWPLPKSKLDE
jgi:hypothetical protein